MLIPIFDDIPDLSNPCGGGNGTNCYHVYGFAAFHIVDLDLHNGQGWGNDGNICPPADRCLGGYFTQFVTLQDGLAYSGPPPPDLGLDSLTLAG